MKTLIPLLITAAVGCASHAEPKVAQTVPPPPPEDVLYVAQAPSAVPAPPGKPVPPTEAVLPGPNAGLVRAHADMARAHADLALNMPFKLGSSSSRRTLVIPKGAANPEILADAEEDLNVMTLILEKALEQRGEDEGRKALGIDVLGGSSGIRNLLIEGHGAIFTLKTKMALVPPPAGPKKEETKTKEERSSEWDDARRQLYGPSEIEKEIQKVWGKVQTSFSSSEEYDEKKLERLKESLTEALKSASNIRHLAGDQSVTVVVLSSSPVTEVRKLVAEAGRSGGGGRGGEGGRGGNRFYVKEHSEEKVEGRSGSRLMLQAKKSDIDSYAKGKLNAEAFREKVKIQVY